NPLTMDMQFDPKEKLTPIATIGMVPFSAVVYPGLNVNTLQELIDLIKNNPGKYMYATNGVAGFVHLTTELFSRQAGGLEMESIAYQGGASEKPDLVAGRVHLYFDSLNGALPFHRNGQTRILATTGPERASATPEIPTVAETLPGFASE